MRRPGGSLTGLLGRGLWTPGQLPSDLGPAPCTLRLSQDPPGPPLSDLSQDPWPLLLRPRGPGPHPLPAQTWGSRTPCLLLRPGVQTPAPPLDPGIQTPSPSSLRNTEVQNPSPSPFRLQIWTRGQTTPGAMSPILPGWKLSAGSGENSGSVPNPVPRLASSPTTRELDQKPGDPSWVFPRFQVEKLRHARRGSFPMIPCPTNQASELLDPGGPSPLVGYTFPIGGLGALGTRGRLSRSCVA